MPQFAFGDHLEPRPMQVIGFNALFQRNRAIDEPSENISGDADDTLVLADSHAELDGLALGVLAGVLGNVKNMASLPLIHLECSYIVLTTSQSQ